MSRRTGFLGVVICGLVATGGAHQRVEPDPDLTHRLSAKPGLVNVAEGDVCRVRDAGCELLISGDELAAGDVVRSGPASRAEILLRPGSYLRLWENSEVSFIDIALDNMKVMLNKGRAIIEGYVLPNSFRGLVLTVLTPAGEVTLMGGGLYRFTVEPDGRTEAAVLKGEAVALRLVVKEGKKALMAGEAPAIADLDRKAEDQLEQWSRERAASLIASNKAISDRVLRVMVETRRARLRGLGPESGDNRGIAATDRVRYLVTTEAGFVHLVEDGVVHSRDRSTWTRLLEGDKLEPGDVVRTGPASRAEILLSPDHYLRLKESSEFSFVDASLDNIKLRLVSGSAIVEGWAADEDDRSPITIISGEVELTILRGGVYRFNAAPDGQVEATVRAGELKVGQTVVGERKRVVVKNGIVNVTPLSSKVEDNFDVWSNTLPRGFMRAGIARWRPVRQNRLSVERSRDFWVLDPLRGQRTFLPYAPSLYSPYKQRYEVYWCCRSY